MVGEPAAGALPAAPPTAPVAPYRFGEGLAIGSSFAFGALQLGTFLIIGFMVHNVTEGLGIAAVSAGERIPVARLAVLALVAGAPAIPAGGAQQ